MIQLNFDSKLFGEMDTLPTILSFDRQQRIVFSEELVNAVDIGEFFKQHNGPGNYLILLHEMVYIETTIDNAIDMFMYHAIIAGRKIKIHKNNLYKVLRKADEVRDFIILLFDENFDFEIKV